MHMMCNAHGMHRMPEEKYGSRTWQKHSDMQAMPAIHGFSAKRIRIAGDREIQKSGEGNPAASPANDADGIAGFIYVGRISAAIYF